VTYSLRTAARVLTASDSAAQTYEKAVELSKLRAWAFAPNSSGYKVAQLLTTIKLLEQLQEQTCPSRPRFKVLASNSDYRKLYDKFLDMGGWEKLRHTKEVKTFDNELEQRVEISRAAAKVIDFSMRYDKSTASPRYDGGSTMARSILVESSTYNIGMKATKLGEIWRQHKRSAVCAYLLHHHGFEQIRLHRISTVHFVPRLIDAAERVNDWRNFFRTYCGVAAALSSRGYTYDDLRKIVGEGSLDLVIDPHPEEVLQKIEEYTPGA
jgi:hypothetical protein